MPFRAAAGLALVLASCAQAPIAPVGTSGPSELPPASSSAAPKGDVQKDCAPILDAFKRAKQNDPDRPTRRVLDAVFDDPPPMKDATREWCREQLYRMVEKSGTVE